MIWQGLIPCQISFYLKLAHTQICNHFQNQFSISLTIFLCPFSNFLFHKPYLQSAKPSGPLVPACALQRPIHRIVEEIPVARILRPDDAASVPPLPAGQHVSVFPKQIPMVVNQQPFINCIGAVCLYIAVSAQSIFLPARCETG